MKVCVGSSRYVLVRRWKVWCIAINSARSMFCSPGSLFAILRFFKGVVYAISCIFLFSVSLSRFFMQF